MSEAMEGDPQWYKDAIIYELHVRTFFDSVDDGVGDFPGLIQKLDYLQDLGITCIWLLPFYPSPLRDDGYDISDYYGVHPSYGTLEDFRQFVREAHDRNIRVITELVVNHTSDQNPWFQAARNAPPGSPERDFYVWSDSDQKYRDARIIFTDTETSNWTWDPVAKAYYWHRFFHHQPDLNFDNPLVLQAVIQVMRFWLDMGVDGMRLDAIPYLIERDGTNCENLPETHVVLKEFRKEMDAHYQGRIFLAEANQWPADVRAYFGDGDECHMAYHFPLMPRIFMATRQEDRHPIIEILGQTPAIPENCQWAIFLRNHDELTLEMVTDEERDYMYSEYASDSKMRINVGIRRRLAPLMDHSRQRMELLYSLLFSLPGTPIMYYGDEIGMGDNVYLGDRNGVRTPMQWTGDRNGGFSRCDFAKLYSPVIVDPLYGYQVVNVEAQQRDQASLLWWMKQMIALRKRYQTFSRGTLEFLHPQNRKILAYLRKHQEQTILCVANLSRFVQPVELDMIAFAGQVPVEMFGNTEFPRITERPYILTLGAHAFYWFELRPSREPALLGTGDGAIPMPVLEINGPYENLMKIPTRRHLEQSVIPQYLTRQRWFGGKARALKSTRVTDYMTIPSDSPAAFLVLVQVDFADKTSDQYCLPLAIATGAQADTLRESSPGSVLARVPGRNGDAIVYDAMANDSVCAALLSIVEMEREVKTRTAGVRGFKTAIYNELRGPNDFPPRIRRGGGGTSNTAIVFDDRLIMKLFRRLEPGQNPELEIGRFLSEKTDYRRLPLTAGAFDYSSAKTEPTVLAIVQQLVNNEGPGWEHALEEIGRFFERASSESHANDQIDADSRSLFDLAGIEPPAMVADTIGTYLTAAAILGRRTAELHLALASDPSDPAFAPEPITPEYLSRVRTQLRKRAEVAIASLAENAGGLPDALREAAQRLIADREQVIERMGTLPADELRATKIRCHGDYHLGQVLRAEGDFIILDFEGEPARPLAERREKESPMRDVAGMLRSFSYAAYSGLFTFTERRPDNFARMEAWARLWQNWTSAVFYSSYCSIAAGASFLPDDPAQVRAWVELFVLEKALYELVYELNNRPTWVRIPLFGILSLVKDPAATPPA